MATKCCDDAADFICNWARHPALGRYKEIRNKKGIKYSRSIPLYEVEVKFGPLANQFPKFVYPLALLLIANTNISGLGNVLRI
jgi:hypothetical protein